MTDPRFFTNAGPFTLGDLAERLGGLPSPGAPRDLCVTDVATLEDAGPSEISMFGDRRYRAAFAGTQAGIVLTNAELAPQTDRAGAPHLIHVPSPRLAFAEAAALFYPETPETMGFEDERDQAICGDNCRIARSAVIGRGAVIGARTAIGANAVIGPGAVIGEDCVIGPNAMVGYAIVGNRVQIYVSASVGVQGFGFVPGPRGLRRVPQLGRVLIGDDVEIGANTTVDRGAIGDTVIGAGTVIDNQIQIGHNVRIGRSCILASKTGIGGSTEIGDFVLIGGGVGVKDHIKIGNGAQLAAGSGVIRDVPPNGVVAGYPAIPVRDWHRQTVALERLIRRGA
jgi:UDP-3-O-[3-hydroxymyristoyl] glucosamine N-acyltransferase